MSANTKAHVEALEDKDWQALIHKNGEASQSQSTCRTYTGFQVMKHR